MSTTSQPSVASPKCLWDWLESSPLSWNIISHLTKNTDINLATNLFQETYGIQKSRSTINQQTQPWLETFFLHPFIKHLWSLTSRKILSINVSSERKNDSWFLLLVKSSTLPEKNIFNQFRALSRFACVSRLTSKGTFMPWMKKVKQGHF